jgi:trehalose synthase-fused probable maltokinase
LSDVRNAVAAGDLSFLETGVLHDWIVEQRWFAAKSREISEVNVLYTELLADEDPLLLLALVEARFPTGTHELYQLPLGLGGAGEDFGDRAIAADADWTLYDALADPVQARRLARLMDGDADHGEMLFRRQPGGPDIRTDVDVRPMGVEQSNSSVVFGDRLVLKVFRRLEPGDNPELEMLRFLTGHGFANIASLAGWYEIEGRRIDATLGVLQTFLVGGRDGWELALEALESADESFFARLEELGQVTGEMHAVLGSDLSDAGFRAEEPSEEALSLLTATLDEQIERTWADLPDDARLEAILGRGQDVRERLQLISHIGAGGRVIRTHGDFHLGQTMLTDEGWVILDFEGEPARPLPERRRKQSPLRDVAGMLRSFAYAASAVERLRGGAAAPGWEEKARAAFLAGYREGVDSALLPPGEDAMARLLAVFELEKAVYELRYELDNRPDWVQIPVAGIERLLEAT